MVFTSQNNIAVSREGAFSYAVRYRSHSLISQVLWTAVVFGMCLIPIRYRHALSGSTATAAVSKPQFVVIPAFGPHCPAKEGYANYLSTVNAVAPPPVRQECSTNKWRPLLACILCALSVPAILYQLLRELPRSRKRFLVRIALLYTSIMSTHVVLLHLLDRYAPEHCIYDTPLYKQMFEGFVDYVVHDCGPYAVALHFIFESLMYYRWSKHVCLKLETRKQGFWSTVLRVGYLSVVALAGLAAIWAPYFGLTDKLPAMTLYNCLRCTFWVVVGLYVLRRFGFIHAEAGEVDMKPELFKTIRAAIQKGTLHANHEETKRSLTKLLDELKYMQKYYPQKWRATVFPAFVFIFLTVLPLAIGLCGWFTAKRCVPAEAYCMFTLTYHQIGFLLALPIFGMRLLANDRAMFNARKAKALPNIARNIETTVFFLNVVMQVNPQTALETQVSVTAASE